MPSIGAEASNGIGGDFRKRSYGAATAEFEDERKNHWSSCQHSVAAVIESQFTDIIMGILIAANAVFVVLETNYKGLEQELPLWLSVATTVLLVIYTIELVARLALYRGFFFYSSWNLFDLFVVGIDIVSELIGRLFGSALPSLSILRVFRVLRLLRFVELLTVFSELSTMVKLMISSVRTMFWGAVLLLVTITFFSILAVEFLHPLNKELSSAGKYDDCERCARAFETVFQANLTFFQQLVFGDSWGRTSVVLIEAHPWTGLLLVAAGVTLQVGLLNLILTVIVDKAHEQHEEDARRLLMAKEKTLHDAKEKLESICADIDADGSGELELGELLKGFETNREFATTLGMMDIKYEDMGVVFDILDEDQSGTVTYHEFVDQLYKMKSQDSQTMLLFIKGYVNELRGKVGEQLRMLRGNLQSKLEEISLSLATIANAQPHANEVAPIPCANGAAPIVDGLTRQNTPIPHIPPSPVLDALQKDLEMCTQKLNAVAERLDARVDQTLLELQTSVGSLADHGGGRKPSGFLHCSEVMRPTRLVVPTPPTTFGVKSSPVLPDEPISPFSPTPNRWSNGAATWTNGSPKSPMSPKSPGVVGS